MRLLIWASSYGQTIGGGPILAPLLAAELGRRGHEVTVLTDRRPESLAEEEERDGVRIFRPLFRRALAGEAALIPGIRRQVASLKRDIRPELAFIFSSGYGEFFHHVTSGGEALPLVVGLHDMFAENEFRPDAIVGKNLRAANRVVACSAAVLENACGYLPALRPLSQVIHNALPPPMQAVRPAPGTTATIAFAGRLIEKKGADTLIAAFDLLKDRYPRIQLALAGEGGERAGLEADVARRGLAARVGFAGSLSHEAIYPFLARATLVAVPSRIEPFGLVALEAAQMARPVVASAVDGLPEIVVHGETGLLVPPGDAAALAGAIAGLLDDPDRAAAMGEAGRRRAEDRFGWERYVSAHERLFSSLLADARPQKSTLSPIDPRTVPRGRLLERLGARRPAASIILLADRGSLGSIEATISQFAGPGCQIILACTDDTQAPAGLTAVRRQADEMAIQQINRAGALASGRLIAVATPGTAGLPELLTALAGDPETGAAVSAQGQDWALIARENLWTALGGLDAAFGGLETAIADFCQRARAIGIRTRQTPLPSGSAADRALLRQRTALCPDLGSLVPRPAGTSPRLSVYTAIAAGYDTLKPQPAEAVGNGELVAFLDDGTAAAYRQRSRAWRIAPLAPEQADPHRAARFPKINAHLALPASGYSLWIDASIGIVCPFPLARLVELFLRDCDICLFRHYARRSVYEEAEACKAHGLDRAEVIDEQMARYRAEGLPEDTGLVEAPVILRRHTPAIRRLNEAWWAEVTAGSRRDQLSFNYVTWKLGLRYATFPLSLAAGNGLFVKFLRQKQGTSGAGPA